MKNLILGIDTGGTYTDAVLITCDTKEVIQTAKALTTRNNLTVGIANSMNRLDIEPERICLVCLSTTLATNAVVENRKTNTGLVIIGKNKLTDDSRPFPSDIVKTVKGEIDILGRETEPLDMDEVYNVLNELKGKIETLAVSGFASVKNQTQELCVKEAAEKILGVPVVCAHELTTSLGFYERTVTTVLNAQLIPLICRLISSTEQVMKEKHIDAPMTIVKGDGHSMISGYAKSCPVETILSGPAASVIGGKFLTGAKDAVIVDMGGTTTDIVCIDNSEAVIEKDGMNIEGWKTRVKSVKVNTFGLGGDSYIRTNERHELHFGPQKVTPVCAAAAEFPYITEEIRKYRLNPEYVITGRQELDFIRLLNPEPLQTDDSIMFGEELKTLLQDGPHSIVYLADRLNTDIDSIDVKKMLDSGAADLISFTPTDILHASGEYRQWDYNAATAAADVFAARMGMSTDRFIEFSEACFVSRLCLCIMDSAIETDGGLSHMDAESTAEYIFRSNFGKEKDRHYQLNFKLNRQLIGIGAPAPVWIRKAAEFLGAEFTIPPHSDVANAIGAAAGDVRERVEAVICRDQFLDNYIVYLPDEQLVYNNLEDAKKEATKKILSYAQKFSLKLGVRDPEIEFNIEDFMIDDICTGKKTFVKSTLSATIKGEFEINRVLV